MLISKNPRGEIEAYTDIGQFIGILPPDYPGLDIDSIRQSAEDEEVWRTNEEGNHFKLETSTGEIKAGFGGKFNGKKIGESWGGENTKVRKPKTGAAKLSGYWLHGLPESRQVQAINKIVDIKKKMKASKTYYDQVMKEIDDKVTTKRFGMHMLELAGLENFRPDMTAEEYVMRCRRKDEKKELTDLMAEARSWPENAQTLMDKNLSDDEKKVAAYFAKKYGFSMQGGESVPDDASGFGRWQHTEADVWLDIKSKALGGPTSGHEIPKDILHAAGVDQGWMYNLSSSTRLTAENELKAAQKEYDHKLKEKKNLETLFAKGILTANEVEERMKERGLDKIVPGMGIEEYIMKSDNYLSKRSWLYYREQAFDWTGKASDLAAERWDENDYKIASALADKYGADRDITGVKVPDTRDISKWDKADLNYWYDLQSKAMSGPVSGNEAPDELQYAAGTKERPAPPEPPKPAGADYGWYKPVRGGQLESYISEVLGDKVSYGHQYTQEEFVDMNQRFLDMMKHGKTTPNDVCYRGMLAVQAMRARALNSTQNGYVVGDIDKPTSEMLDRLTPEEKRHVLDFVNRFATGPQISWVGRFSRQNFDSLDQVTYGDLRAAENYSRRVNGNTIRSQEKQQPFKDYILAMEKMLTGAAPTDKASYEKAQTELAEAEIREAMEKVTVTPERAKELQNGNTTAISEARSMLVTSLPPAKLSQPLSHRQIVDKVGGPDRTKGSCLSAAMTYVANKFGFDVLDFRGGESRSIFAKLTTMQELANTPGVDGKIELQKNELKSVEKLFKTMEDEKEYILSCGRHCSVVRRNEQGVLQYLELQNDSALNGWQDFSEDKGKTTLKKRFACQMKYGSSYGKNYMRPCVLIEVDKLRGCKGFEDALQYINTNQDQQRKGAGGGVK